ncbi:MAG: hypothetical protein Q8M88_01725 [Phenylobacterium sp.]|uniref:hypothetical protein n=1 Tax=Phenylobacterium sp. TaxID=1871053 RepID=UPI002734CA51|nr:hypothetical protein [Phenylobacterium sp.]MDP3173136.1 hypothetical protein [Phenylobacterium sp.]
MRRFVLGSLLLALAGCSGEGGGEATAPRDPQQAFQGGPQQGPQGGARQPSADAAQQALQGLYAIRQQQCQTGNTLACQSLGAFAGQDRQLAQAGQACRAGDQRACEMLDTMSQNILKAYAESAQVMQAGAQGAAQMDAWRSQMNANHAANMARLGAQAAAGQAAHQARQENYAAMNQTWANGQAAVERNTGRFNDYIYEGTTVSGGGVQTFVPHGSTGYTDGAGNVVVGQEGGEAPSGWRQMDPTYAAPD